MIRRSLLPRIAAMAALGSGAAHAQSFVVDTETLHEHPLSPGLMWPSALASADFDGDGYDDLVTGEESSDRLFVYYGTAAGLDPVAQPIDPSPEAAIFGSSVGVGDFDGDGLDDVVVAATGTDGNQGAAFVYYGNVTGLTTIREQKITATDTRMFFGFTVAALGDLDGDGYDDIAVQHDRFGDDAALYLYYGSPAGIDDSVEQVLEPADVTTLGDAGSFGASMAAGDFDGDGFRDLVVGDPDEDTAGSDAGAAYVYYGTAGGIDAATEEKLTAADGAADGLYGWAVASMGDPDGDGAEDLVVGAFRHDADLGAAYLYDGAPTGIDPASERKVSEPGTDELGEMFAVGDFSGDGIADLAVTARGTNTALGTNAGRVHLYPTSAGGPDLDCGEPLEASDGGTNDNFGNTIASGDFDGDGQDELAVGRTSGVYVYDFAEGDRSCFGVVLTVTGVCPSVTIEARGLTPGGDFLLFAGLQPGSAGLSGAVCPGTPTGVSQVRELVTARADAVGEFSVTRTIPTAACGALVQVADDQTCDVSNVETF